MQVLCYLKRVVGMSMLILFLGACAAPSTPVKNDFTVTPEEQPWALQSPSGWNVNNVLVGGGDSGTQQS